MTPNTILRLVLVALAAAVFQPSGRILEAADRTGELAGVVVDLDGRPVANAKVWLESRPSATIAATTTSSDGRFHLGPLAPFFARSCSSTLPDSAANIGRMCRSLRAR